MRTINIAVFFLLLCSAVGGTGQCDKPQGNFVFYGTSDASCAVALSEDMFVVADDENNILRVYKTINNSGPVCSYDLTGFLDVGVKFPEADIEGATSVGNRVYWITSHGRNKDGKMRPNRYRFFATSVKVENQKVTIEPVGVLCRSLVQEIIQTKSMRKLSLDRATQFNAELKKEQRKMLAPKNEGLNIEALCASHDGRTMYIGFRNPRLRTEPASTPEALVVPLNNCRQVIETARAPVFGEPMLWDLAGLGIISMEYSDFHKAYFIIAGAHDGRRKFALYRWSGKRNMPPVLVRELQFDKDDFTPEALAVFAGSDKLLGLSDDGALLVDVSSPFECMEGELTEDGKCPNKYLISPRRKYFRGIWLKP
jgi:hypothetical protein